MFQGLGKFEPMVWDFVILGVLHLGLFNVQGSSKLGLLRVVCSRTTKTSDVASAKPSQNIPSAPPPELGRYLWGEHHAGQ